MKNILLFITCAISLAFLGCSSSGSVAPEKLRSGNEKKVSIPLAGNGYLTKGAEGEDITDKGIDQWHSSSNVYSVYVKIPQATAAIVAVRGHVISGQGTIQLSVDHASQKKTINNTSAKEVTIGKLQLNKGYNRLDIKGLSPSDSDFPKITALILTVPRQITGGYVKDNKSNHFYWGRPGPSIHLNYQMSTDKDAEWFYNEVTVPDKMDPIGSYFMAGGFREGYFGMQVNSASERHILFSVWSPYDTDDPDEIPASERIKLLKKGKNVQSGKFGSEGSGGQSYWNYEWSTGQTYKFLMHVKPDHNGNTVYTAYFYAPSKRNWKLIASFRRPKTDSWLTHVHSFLENFKDANGYETRKAYYGNQWIRDKEGKWHQITKAIFNGDNIANIGYRKDYRGGADSVKFYMQNGGFFNEYTKLRSSLTRKTSTESPDINFSKLP